MVRHTKQRQAVIEVLRASTDHPDAAWIHSQVRAELPNISLGTVYRTLDALVRDGLVMTLERAGHATRYDYKSGRQSHHHAICQQCGTIIDLPSDAQPALPSSLPKGFQVNDVKLEFLGLCPSCAAKQS